MDSVAAWIVWYVPVLRETGMVAAKLNQKKSEAFRKKNETIMRMHKNGITFSPSPASGISVETPTLHRRVNICQGVQKHQ